eukprot:359923_1
MGKQQNVIFAIISGVCCIILVTVFVRYIFAVYKINSQTKTTGKRPTIDPLVRRCATISLFGYTIFILISFILHLITSLSYMQLIHVQYTKLLCQIQTFNIIFFMIVCILCIANVSEELQKNYLKSLVK